MTPQQSPALSWVTRSSQPSPSLGYVAVVNEDQEPLRTPRSESLTLSFLHEQLNPFATPPQQQSTASLIWMPLAAVLLISIHCVVFYPYMDVDGAICTTVPRPPAPDCLWKYLLVACRGSWGRPRSA